MTMPPMCPAAPVISIFMVFAFDKAKVRGRENVDVAKSIFVEAKSDNVS
jgi:hypothetical protein